MPAAAMMPACRIPPPMRDRCARASAITSAAPQSSEPTGAPRPFDRQNIIVSAAARRSRGDVSSAIAAFQIRAPSTCTRKPPSCASLHRVVISSTAIGAPDAAMYVFSMTSIVGVGRWCARPSIADVMPSGRSQSGCICTPLFSGRRRGFVAVDVGAVRAQHLGAARREHADRELVRHRSRRHVERGFLADEGRRK